MRRAYAENLEEDVEKEKQEMKEQVVFRSKLFIAHLFDPQVRRHDLVLQVLQQKR